MSASDVKDRGPGADEGTILSATCCLVFIQSSFPAAWIVERSSGKDQVQFFKELSPSICSPKGEGDIRACSACYEGRGGDGEAVSGVEGEAGGKGVFSPFMT